MIIQIKNNWSDAELLHNNFLNKKLDLFLNTNKPITKLNFTRQFLKIVKPLITSNKNEDILESISLFNIAESLLTKESLTDFRSDLKKILNYSNFTKKIKGWDAYKLCSLSKTRTCPYCHQAYSFTIIGVKKSKSLRPTLDHFYSKDRYPHLSLSLANLVPSCAICNSTLKGNTDFLTTPHLHPLFDEENIIFSFDTKKYSILDIVSSFQNIKSELTIKIAASKKCEKTENSIITFDIFNRYKNLHSEATDFVSSKSTLHRLLSERTIDLDYVNLEHQVLRFDRRRYSDYLLGKMYADLYDVF